MWFQNIIEYFSGFYGVIELIATITLIINVYLITQQKLSNYIWGAIGVALFGYLFLSFKLYSDMLLQWIFYLPLQAYGYYVWKYKGQNGLDSLPVSKMNLSSFNGIISFIICATLLTGYYMSEYTDASFPYADALTTWLSIVASILLLWKYIENWIIWITMDAIAIFIYYSKELYVTSGLYVVFLCLAIYGLVTWIRETYISPKKEIEHA